MKLQPTKFQYSTEKINFAGIVISKKGVEPDPDRMSGLAKYPRPTSTKDVKAFLGCATSLSSFSSVLLQDCKYLRALTTKGAAFHWGEEGEMRRIIQSLNNKQVVVRNDHLPFVQAFNSYQPGLTKAKKNLSGTLRSSTSSITWAAATSMVRVDAMSHHPVDRAESMGPDPIDNQHQHMNDIVNNIEDEDDNDNDNNIEVQVDDPLCSGLFHAAQHHQQAIKQMQDGDKIDWKELPTGTYIRQFRTS